MMWRRCMAWAETPRGRRVIALKLVITLFTVAYWVHPILSVVGSMIWLWSKFDA